MAMVEWIHILKRDMVALGKICLGSQNVTVCHATNLVFVIKAIGGVKSKYKRITLLIGIYKDINNTECHEN